MCGVWSNATLNAEYRHFVKAPEGKKTKQISFTIQAMNSQYKSALCHILVCRISKASESRYFHERKRNKIYFNPTMVTWNTLIRTYKNVSENTIISHIQNEIFSV